MRETPPWIPLLEACVDALGDHAAVTGLRHRARSAGPRIGLVGAAKSGRSTLLNTLAGAELLHTAAHGQTDGVIELAHSAAPWIQTEPPAEDQAGGSGPPDAAGVRAAALQGSQQAGGRLCLGWPGTHPDATWIEVPAGCGPDHPIWLELDGLMIVSDAQQALSRDQLDRLGALVPGIPVVALVLSRADRVLENAHTDGISEDEALAMARRSSQRRMRRLLEGTVPIWTTPPWPHTDALRDRLATMAPALAVRADAAEAALLNHLITALDEREARVLAALTTHPAAGRPSPEVGAAEAAAQVSTPVVAAVRACLHRVADAAEAAVRSGEDAVHDLLNGATSKPELRARARSLASDRHRRTQLAETRAQADYHRLLQPTVQLHADCAARQLAAMMGQAPPTPTTVQLSADWPPAAAPEAGPAESDAMSTHDRDRRRWMAGAAAAGAVAGAVLGGSLLVPAAVAGGVATAAFNQLTPLSRLREQLATELITELTDAADALGHALRSRRADLEQAAEHAVLGATRASAAAWAARDAEERAALDRERARSTQHIAVLTRLRNQLADATPQVQGLGPEALAGSAWPDRSGPTL